MSDQQANTPALLTAPVPPRSGRRLADVAVSSLAAPAQRARGASLKAPKRFIYLGTEHGGGSFANSTGPKGRSAERRSRSGPDNTARLRPARAHTSGANASLSPILTAASASRLTPAIVAKMNVLRGDRSREHVGHQDGAHLGNNSSQVGDRAGTSRQDGHHRPADGVLPELLRGRPSPRARAVSIGGIERSPGPTQPVDPHRRPEGLQKFNSSLQLFRSIFGTVPTATRRRRRPLIIDRVRQNYGRCGF